MGEIEPETLTKVFGRETFFSLFSEQSPVYEAVIDGLKQGFKNEMNESEVGSAFFRGLSFALDRPVPLTAVMDDDPSVCRPCEMSVLKQSLLFFDRMATANLFKVAEQLGVHLSNVIDCLEDLELILDRLSAQQYSLLLSKLEKNVSTQAVKEAIMAKRGERSKMVTFLDESAIIWQHTEALGLQREQTDEEVKQTVKVRVLPLQLIQPYESQVGLFRFIRENLERLQGSLLLNAIFQAFWQEQRQVIFRSAFLPFFIFFLTANFYYT